MNFVRFSPRLAACSVALAAALGGVGFAANPASAATYPSCLDANRQVASGPGSVIQWYCNDSDNYQNWTVIRVGQEHSGSGPEILLYVIKNNQTSQCLDADAQQAYPGGAVIQWPCDYGSFDGYVMWIRTQTPEGYSFQNAGATYQGGALCLDANAQQTYNFGKIIQWPCQASDPFQNWFVQTTDHDGLQNVGA